MGPGRSRLICWKIRRRCETIGAETEGRSLGCARVLLGLVSAIRLRNVYCYLQIPVTGWCQFVSLFIRMGIMAKQDQTVEQLFGSALNHKPEDRRAFLDGACAGAPELRQRVEKLLLADE